MTKRLLIADDEVEITTSLKSFFQSKGYQVETAFDVQGAISKLQEFNPQAVILDMKLDGVSEKSGLGVMREAKKLIPDVKIVVMSSSYSEELGKRAQELGAAQYIIKPIRLKDIYEKIEELTRDL